MPPILRLEGLSKRYGALVVTDDVTLEVGANEIHAVIGPNGAGKTTLVHQISGLARPDAGRILFAGEDVTRLPMATRVRKGLARSFQITTILPGFSALENVALAVQARAGSSFRFLREASRDASLNAPAAAILADLGLAERMHRPAGLLSHGEKRRLELAIALATRPKLLLLDEPLAGTSHEEAGTLVPALRRLKETCAVILVEHDMEAVFALADRVSVLVYGKIIATGSPETIRRDPEVRRAYLGEEGDLGVLRVEGLEAGYGAASVLFGVSLTVAAGEAVTLIGRNGMGKTTTVRAIMGLVRPRGGSVSFEGRPLAGAHPYRIAQAGIGLVPEGRQIFPTLTVEENLVATAVRGTGPGAARWTLERIYDLFPRLEERRANLGTQLSGGEQQMLAIGRALMTNPRLVILDEATEGLAPLVRQTIWDALARLKAEGHAILVIDKNIDALTRLADRHAVIEKGRIVWQGTSAELRADPAVKERFLHV